MFFFFFQKPNRWWYLQNIHLVKNQYSLVHQQGSSPPGAVKTKYVVHYMPWFLGFDEGYDHWCQGNMHYESYLGVYDLNNRNIIQTQLDLMQNSSIDGLWIDYQLSTWNSVIDIIFEETAIRGMGVAIVVDSVSNPNIFVDSRDKLIEWTSLPNYFRVDGRPVIPVFQTPDINFQALPFDTYYIVRRQSNPPSWANGSLGSLGNKVELIASGIKKAVIVEWSSCRVYKKLIPVKFVQYLFWSIPSGLKKTCWQ